MFVGDTALAYSFEGSFSRGSARQDCILFPEKREKMIHFRLEFGSGLLFASDDILLLLDGGKDCDNHFVGCR